MTMSKRGERSYYVLNYLRGHLFVFDWYILASMVYMSKHLYAFREPYPCFLILLLFSACVHEFPIFAKTFQLSSGSISELTTTLTFQSICQLPSKLAFELTPESNRIQTQPITTVLLSKNFSMKYTSHSCHILNFQLT